MGELPAVELISGAFYWVKPTYGDDADTWVVARWQNGSFWVGNRDIAPSAISGPIPTPAQGDVGGDQL